MVDFVLVPVDGSEPSTGALEYALEIAADHGATVQLLFVADTNKPSLVRHGGTVVDVLETEGEDVLDDARDRARDRGVPVTADVVQGEPTATIVEAADPERVDLVVMGTHGRDGLEQYVLGSVTERVVNASETPVLTVRAGEDATHPYPYDEILVPTDGSDHARTALRRAAEVATRHDATVHLLSVVDESIPRVGSVPDRLEEAAREVVRTEAAVASDAGIDDVETAIERGSVPDAIRAYASEHGVDLVVVGTHGRTGFDERLLGTTAERVLRTAPIPVLTTGSRDE